MKHPTQEPRVIVVGAGPVGLTLAIDLGKRGVAVLLVEQKEAPAHLPKMERSNARSMEMFRRLGIADRIRAVGLPADVPMDVYVTTRLVDEPILHLSYPSPGQAAELARKTNDATLPLESQQLVSQYSLEPLLKEVAEEQPSVTVRYSCALEDFEQDENGVTVRLSGSNGTETVRAEYLVGCDGGTSTVRKALGIQLDGKGKLGSLRQVFFRSRDLHRQGPGRREGAALLLRRRRCPDDRDSNGGAERPAPLHLPHRTPRGHRLRLRHLRQDRSTGRSGSSCSQLLDLAPPRGRPIPHGTRTPRRRRGTPRDPTGGPGHEHRDRRRNRPCLEAGRNARGLGWARLAGLVRGRPPPGRSPQRSGIRVRSPGDRGVAQGIDRRGCRRHPRGSAHPGQGRRAGRCAPAQGARDDRHRAGLPVRRLARDQLRHV